MSDYTPTVDYARRCYVAGRIRDLVATGGRAVDLHDEFRRLLDVVRAEERARIATQSAIRSAALFETAWDEGNAMGLDGWTGPERGETPDQHAVDRRERTVDRLVDELRARIAREGAPGTTPT